MSKSDPSDLSRINLMDDADTILKKIRKAKTDPDALPSEADGLKDRPEAENLVGFTRARRQVERRGACRIRRPAILDLQPALADLAVSVLSPITGEMRRLMGDTAHIDAILPPRAGSGARERVPRRPCAEVREIIGFLAVVHENETLRAPRRRCMFTRMVSTRSHEWKAIAQVHGGDTTTTPECGRAVHYAGMRAKNSNGGLVLLYVIADGDFQQWWASRRSLRAEARDEAEATLAKIAQTVRERIGIEPDNRHPRGHRHGNRFTPPSKRTATSRIPGAAAGSAKEGPGPLVSSIAGKACGLPDSGHGHFPNLLTDEEIDALT